MEEKSAAIRQHKIVLENRSVGTITGISDVVHVTRLNLEKGEVDMEGNVDSLAYSSNEALHRSAESFLTRLFK